MSMLDREAAYPDRSLTIYSGGETFTFYADAIPYIFAIGKDSPDKPTAWRRAARFGRRLNDAEEKAA